MKRLCVALVAIIVGLTANPANAATALLVGGYGPYATLTDEQMATALGGYFADYDKRVAVTLPDTYDLGYSIAEATKTLYAAVYDPQYAGPKTIGGVSQGTPAVWEVLRLLADDPKPPPPSELNVVVYGDPEQQSHLWGTTVRGYTYQPPPETPYNVIVVTAQYDGVADFPDMWWNLLAVVNAGMGAIQLHVAAAFNDLKAVPPQNITTVTNSKGGTTTTYLIPTPILPLLQPLAQLGVDQSIVSALDGLLRPIIDSAYLRNSDVAPRLNTAAASGAATAPGEPAAVAAPATQKVTNRESAPSAASTVADEPPIDHSQTTETEKVTNRESAPSAASTVADEPPIDHSQETAIDKVANGQPKITSTSTSTVDLTHGNNLRAGQAPPTDPTEHATGVLEHEQERVTAETSHADDGLANARDHVSDGGPGRSDATTGATSRHAASGVAG